MKLTELKSPTLLLRTLFEDAVVSVFEMTEDEVIEEFQKDSDAFFESLNETAQEAFNTAMITGRNILADLNSKKITKKDALEKLEDLTKEIKVLADMELKGVDLNNELKNEYIAYQGIGRWLHNIKRDIEND